MLGAVTRACGVTVDQFGNIFARRPGRDDTLAPVMTAATSIANPRAAGSHGAYGVLAGLEEAAHAELPTI